VGKGAQHGRSKAVLRVDDRHEYALVRYLGSPGPGTEVWIHEDCPDVAERTRLLLDTLAVSADSISWVHPNSGIS